MKPILSGKAMPLRLLLSAIAAALLLAATVGVGLYLGLETRDRFQGIDESWRTYTAQADRRGELLSRIRGHLGYGGIIHNFKNYVLRQDKVYLDRVIVQFNDFSAIIHEYQQNQSSREELAHLATVEDTINEYASKLPIAIRAAKEGWSTTRTDKLVKVDDTKAIQALMALDVYWRDKRLQSTKAIANSVIEGKNLVNTGFRYLVGLLVISLLLYTLFYILQKELRQTVGLLSKELSERKAAQYVAKKFTRAVEQSPATILITGTDGVIEYVNRKFSELSGYQAHEVIGQTPHLLQSGDTSPDAYLDLRRQIALGEEWRGIFRNKKKHGGYYSVRTAILPLRDENGMITHFIGIGEDISEREKARVQIQKAQKMEAVGLLASGVAHDFNNVLTTILGNVHLALLETTVNQGVYEELVHIEIAAKRARNLVGRILAFARRQPGAPVQLRIDEAISEVCRLMRASIATNIELDCGVEDQSLFVLADPTRLHQVIVNLCSNAAEAIGIEGGKITIRARGIAAESQCRDLVEIVVSDTGPGIPKEHAKKIFEPFFTTKPVGKGTGLGLPVVANLVGEMGGRISATSRLGEGTRFVIQLPQVQMVEQKISPQELMTIGGRERILLIDDEHEVVLTCQKLLEKLGYKVDAHTDPRRAIEAFKTHPKYYDLVMTDYVMPHMDGGEVIKMVRGYRAECPVIVCTAYQPKTLDARSLGPLQIVEKPIDPSVLSHAVRLLLDKPIVF
jgi:PAS domain S-box-containing protein